MPAGPAAAPGLRLRSVGAESGFRRRSSRVMARLTSATRAAIPRKRLPIRSAGPAMLKAATAYPSDPRMGAARHLTPATISSSSME